MYLFWGGRCTPRDQVHPPGPGTPPRPGTHPLDQLHPPGTRYHTPSGPGTPPQGQVQNPRTRYTPLCRACWEIRSTHGLYASYWNAILYEYSITASVSGGGGGSILCREYPIPRFLTFFPHQVKLCVTDSLSLRVLRLIIKKESLFARNSPVQLKENGVINNIEFEI